MKLESGIDLELRGTPIDEDLFRRIIIAIQGANQYPIVGLARFDKAQLGGNIDFSGTHFSQIATFNQARFGGKACFDSVQFNGNAEFENAQFRRDVSFEGANFGTNAYFSMAQFHGEASFTAASFNGHAWFGGTRFGEDATFAATQFKGEDVDFIGTRFDGWAGFVGARFNGDLALDGVEVAKSAAFDEIYVKQAVEFGPLLVADTLTLDGATFEDAASIEVVASKISCVAVRFSEEADFSLRFAEIVVERTTFAKPSTISFFEDTFTYRAVGETRVDEDADIEMLDESLVSANRQQARPRVLSLRGVDVSKLVLANVDLRSCLFAGAHNLDQLRIEGPRLFASSPPPWRLRVMGRRLAVWVPWTRRQTLAKEHHWRSQPCQVESPEARLSRPHWHQPDTQVPRWLIAHGLRVQRLLPDHVASLYRALRKAEEDNKNEPGAADFYYGEMEMRRKAISTPRGERFILWLYWSVSGYGLRGLRALLVLVITIAALATVLQAIGFNAGDPSFRDSLIYAAQNTLSIQGSKLLADRVSWAGEVVRIALRLVGPILIGLALLSVRNRVKR
jgi:Pentapeptide repeats (9 copies)